MKDQLIVKGARQHNLKNIDISLPRDQFIVLTGLSGSGKSSLAFDTIYAEGQRRYVESLSAYARQFWDKWINPMSIILKVYLQLFLSTKRRRVATLVLRLVP